jgi:hypothetical protein
MHKILEDLMRKRKIIKEILLGIAVVSGVLAYMLSYYYFTGIAH